MKRIIAVILTLFSFSAFAACDVTATMKVMYKGDPVGESMTKWVGLSVADADVIHKKGQTVLDVASKVQDKKGNYSAEFSETHVCDGVSKNVGGALVEGVTVAGMGQVLRQGTKVGLELIKMGEDEGKKGKKRAWGKE